MLTSVLCICYFILLFTLISFRHIICSELKFKLWHLAPGMTPLALQPAIEPMVLVDIDAMGL